MKQVFYFPVILIIYLPCLLSCKKDSKITNGAVINTNQAMPNTSITIGGTGWTFDSCSVVSNTISAYHNSTIVKLIFGGGAVFNGNYSFIPTIPLSGQAEMIITNAPGQSSGINWYSKSGLVSVYTGTNGIVATFSNIPCLQASSINPTVNATGTITCQ